MSGAGIMTALLSLGLGFGVGTDAHADADNVEAAPPQPSSVGDPSASEATTASFKVERIDRSNRSMVVQGPDGSRMTVRVSPTVEGFDKLEKGDQVELDYYASSVLSFGPTNTAAAALPGPARAASVAARPES